MVIYFGIVKDRIAKLSMRILKRGYFIVLILGNIIKENYKKECILWLKMLDKNSLVFVCKILIGC